MLEMLCTGVVKIYTAFIGHELYVSGLILQSIYVNLTSIMDQGKYLEKYSQVTIQKTASALNKFIAVFGWQIDFDGVADSTDVFLDSTGCRVSQLFEPRAETCD